MSLFYNISSVAQYESRLLLRSWFFRIFALLLLLFVVFFNIALLFEGADNIWIIKAIPSNAAYLNLLYINFVEAIIAVFLASDFLKRDKKLDTSEVFYVHPLSNAEYVLGKIWGNIRIFLVLNVILVSISLIFSFSASIKIDWNAYLEYFLLINIPTLVFIIGLSALLMLIFKNQAITFVVILAYIGLSVFYLKSKCYFLFDYMAYALPLMKSSITGFTWIDKILMHRLLYFFAGMGFIFITITLFARLPNSPRSKYPWIAASILALLLSAGLGTKYIKTILNETDMRKLYTEINNRYVHEPKMVVDDYKISLTQLERTIEAEARLTGKALTTTSALTFCLNPGLAIDSITDNDGNRLNFKREHQIILIDFENLIEEGRETVVNIAYHGAVDDRFCYLDIPAELLNEYYTSPGFMVTSGKQYSFQQPEYLLLTPESYWYPRPGAAYSDESPDWQQTYFSWFDLTVKPLAGLTPVSQGEIIPQNDSLSVRFLPESPLQSITLSIGRYEHLSTVAGGLEFGVWYFKGHDFFSAAFDSITERIPDLLIEQLENIERAYRLDYPFNRFNIVEVPAQFDCYPHTWTQAQEAMQPEMALMVEKAWKYPNLDFKTRVENTKSNGGFGGWGGGGGNRQMSDREAQNIVFNTSIGSLFLSSSNFSFNMNRGTASPLAALQSSNPYFIYPELFNFRFNIYSSKWPVANRIIELYLQNREATSGMFSTIGMRAINTTETANLLLEKYSFHDLLALPAYSDILNSITQQKTSLLFSKAEMNIGTAAFRDSVFSVIKRNEFANINFEALLDTLSAISDADIYSETETWNSPTPLPFYDVQKPSITVVTDRGAEKFVVSQIINNLSNHDGIVHINVRSNVMTVSLGGSSRRGGGGGFGGGFGGGSRMGQTAFESDTDPKTNRKLVIKAGECKKIVTLLDDNPMSVSVNTLVSRNLPNEFMFMADNVLREQRALTETEGDFTVSAGSTVNPDEITVDNEDTLLFSVSNKTVEGLLPKLLHKQEEQEFRYNNIPWFTFHEWMPTINNQFYGLSIRSAMVIHGGNGSQTATWKIPLPSPGEYDIYYNFPTTMSFGRRGGRSGGRNRRQDTHELHFVIRHGDQTEDAFINTSENGWLRFRDTYYFDADTVSITLTDRKAKGEEDFLIIADAVKLVKR